MDFKKIDGILHLSPEELAKLSAQELVPIIIGMRDLLYDPLTGLRDRRQFSDGLESEVRNNTAFVLFDVDHFKRINDTYGHNFGDVVLSSIGDILSENSRQSNGRTVDAIRYGGEEFLMVLPETGIEAAVGYANRILENVREKEFYPTGFSPLRVTISAGVSHFDINYNPQKDKIQMVMEADLALYNSKRNGRNRVSKFEGAFSSQQLSLV